MALHMDVEMQAIYLCKNGFKGDWSRWILDALATNEVLMGLEIEVSIINVTGSRSINN